MNNKGAWHNNQEEKDWMVSEAKGHARADRFFAGTFGDMKDGADFKGCSVGCSIRSINMKNDTSIDCGSHEALAKYIGLEDQVWLMRLQDSIFEALDGGDQTYWTERLFSAIPVGSDISLVLPGFLSFVLTDTLAAVRGDSQQRQKDSIQGVIVLMNEWHKTGVKPSHGRFADAAANAAYAANADAADAAYAANAAAANANANAANAANAAYAAYTANAAAANAANAANAAAAAARGKKWSLYADKLIELLTECGE